QGNDTITTGAGNDFISGDDGNDSINSGAGDDFVAGGLGADTINAGDGNDTIINNDHKSGSAADDVDVIDGGAGFNSAEQDSLDSAVSNIQFFFDRSNVPASGSAKVAEAAVASPTLSKKGTLEIPGTSKADDFSVTQNDTIVGVSVNGVGYAFGSSKVKIVVVECGAGNDLVAMQTS